MSDRFSQALIDRRVVGEAMGIAQHHDAVSGTEKQEVAYDYALRLSDGIGTAVVSDQLYHLR